jgi:hypothetical protein
VLVPAILANDEEADEGADDEVEKGPHRPIVAGRPVHESGFPTPTPSEHLLGRTYQTVLDAQVARNLLTRPAQ